MPTRASLRAKLVADIFGKAGKSVGLEQSYLIMFSVLGSGQSQACHCLRPALTCCGFRPLCLHCGVGISPSNNAISITLDINVLSTNFPRP